MNWKCPKCGGTRLCLTITTAARLIQCDDGNFETEDAGFNHEWDGESTMWCRDCEYCNKVKDFEGHEECC